MLTTSARFTTDFAKLLVRTTDCRICSNCRERWGKKARLPWAPSPGPLSPRTYQLVVVDHNQLYILGLAVHCGVAPADLEGGWALGISPLHVCTHGQTMGRLVGRGILVSSQGWRQPPAGRECHPSQPGEESRGHAVSEGPEMGTCVDTSIRQELRGPRLEMVPWPPL